MRTIAVLWASITMASALHAQVPTTPRDSAARAKAKADSIAADSIALVRELEQMQRGDAGDTTRGTQVAGPSNPRFTPDISAIGDLVADLSPDGSTQESGNRFDIREVELAIGAAVDPYFRADFILGLSDLEGIAIEEAYLTALSLPAGLQARIGRFHMPFGKQNTTHRAELQTIEYPHVIQRFFSPEGLKGSGFWVSRIFAPFGFYQELQATAVNRLGDAPEDGVTLAEPLNKRLSGLGYSARLRNYWDFSEAANLELSFSAMTGRVEQPLGTELSFGSVTANAVPARQSDLGVDFTYRWKPLERALYKSFILQGEVIHQLNEDAVAPLAPRICAPAPTCPLPDFGRSLTGGYVLARYQLTRRSFFGTRFDLVKNPDASEGSTKAGSAFLQFFPSEFSKFVVAYELLKPGTGLKSVNRILLQTTFAVGPHRPHPF